MSTFPARETAQWDDADGQVGVNVELHEWLRSNLSTHLIPRPEFSNPPHFGLEACGHAVIYFMALPRVRGIL
jgi:hypothetical protein